MTGQNTKKIPNGKMKGIYLTGQNARKISDRVKYKEHTVLGKTHKKHTTGKNTRKVPDRAK